MDNNEININDMTSEEMVELYAEQLLKDKGEETSEEKILALKERIIDRINMATLNALPAEKLEELNASLENGADVAQIQEAVDNAEIDVAAIAQQAMRDFREEYLKEQ